MTSKTNANGTKNVELIVPLKFLSDSWKTPRILLINCKINLDLKTWTLL